MNENQEILSTAEGMMANRYQEVDAGVAYMAESIAPVIQLDEIRKSKEAEQQSNLTHSEHITPVTDINQYRASKQQPSEAFVQTEPNITELGIRAKNLAQPGDLDLTA